MSPSRSAVSIEIHRNCLPSYFRLKILVWLSKVNGFSSILVAFYNNPLLGQGINEIRKKINQKGFVNARKHYKYNLRDVNDL